MSHFVITLISAVHTWWLVSAALVFFLFLTVGLRYLCSKKQIYESQILKTKLELEQSKQLIATYEDRYRDLVNTVDGIVWEAEIGSSGYSFVSQQAEVLLGFPVQFWYEKPSFWQSILHSEDRARMTGTGYLTATAKQDARIEYRVLNSKGQYLWMRDYIKVVQDPGGFTHMRGIMVDITQQKNIEAELEKAKSEAVDALAVKTQFLANMGHEIRTPLNAIMGMTAIALDVPLSSEQRENLLTIQSAGDALLTLVNDILDYTRLESGKAPLDSSEFDLRKCVQNAMDIVSSRAFSKNIAMNLDFPDVLPRYIHGDHSRVLQLILNLLNNAVKFTPERGLIEIRVGQSEGSLRFEVYDTGPGISDDNRDQIFQPFFQVDSSMSRKAGGSGLGLATCKQLAQIMGGTIGFEKRLGGGSLFWFEIPLISAMTHELIMEKQAENILRLPLSRGNGGTVDEGGEEDSTLRPSPRLNILVVEDNPANQQVVKRFMDKLKIHSEIASDGVEAVGRFRETNFDLILMDCQMPEMDGYEATRQIREIEAGSLRKPTPIVAFTAHALLEDKIRCEDAGMNDYLSKPVRLHQLQSMIRKWTSPPPENSQITRTETEDSHESTFAKGGST